MEANPNSQFKVILGSSSVARRKIFAEMGYNFTLMSADIDEKAIRKEKPEDLVMAIAEGKADAIISKLSVENQGKDDKSTIVVTADTAEAMTSKLPIGEHKTDAEPTLLITCDQVVVYEGMIREKPSSIEEAREFIKGYSGGHAATVSSVIVTNLKSGFRRGDWDKVEIHFQKIPEQVIDSLIEEGLVLNVAGALIIEHPLILPYVKEVIGATDSVMGLPKVLTERLMKEVLQNA